MYVKCAFFSLQPFSKYAQWFFEPNQLFLLSLHGWTFLIPIEKCTARSIVSSRQRSLLLHLEKSKKNFFATLMGIVFELGMVFYYCNCHTFLTFFNSKRTQQAWKNIIIFVRQMPPSILYFGFCIKKSRFHFYLERAPDCWFWSCLQMLL